ncbi:hypothetical protein B296_00018114 [Ensete ventricosum]|uniref:Uncharacterized protein n=1 Tax=Ensete ventricosum TaxID=4639 RepID=A0A427AUE3_ENSVE|nr:hypothetical protein B296_00018114 [Ensete ventricosum]
MTSHVAQSPGESNDLLFVLRVRLRTLGASLKASDGSASVPVISKEEEEFQDWSQAWLAIGTLGNRDIQEDPQRHESLENLQASDFTMEEVDRFQVELVKLLTRKPNSSTGAPEIAEADRANPLPNRFLDRPWSLEVDGKPENDNHGDLSPSAKIILSKVGDALLSNRTAIKKESLSFLLKKMFVCGSGFAPPRNPIPEPRIDKILRAVLAKKIYPQTPALAPANKYLENKPTEKMQEEEDKRKDQYKWVKTDSECKIGFHSCIGAF